MTTANTRAPLSARVRQLLAARPRLLRCVRALGAGAFSFALSGAGLVSQHVPLALALVGALPFGGQSICAYLGALAGYGTFWGFSAALEPVAAGFLLLAGSCLLGSLIPRERPWLCAGAAVGLYAILGIIFVLQADGAGAAVLRLLLRLTLLAGSVRALHPAAQTQLRRAAACLALLAGISRVALPFGIPLAVLPATIYCLQTDSAQLPVRAAACGVVLDFGCAPSPPQTLCFCLGALLSRLFAARRGTRAVCFVLAQLLCLLVMGGTDVLWLFGVVAGALIACMLPQPVSAAAPRTAQSVLQDASQILFRLENKLALAQTPQSTAPALIFDSAAGSVCRSCVRNELCWRERADETYRQLSACAGVLLHRKRVERDDLPAAFRGTCLRAEAFRAALNDALRAQQIQLRADEQAHEARQLARAQFGHLARFLQALAKPPAPDTRARFQAVLGVRAVGLRGDALCGDCGTSFVYRTRQYVLLCDGMGTGADARRDAQEAMELVRALVQAGFAAPEAMQLLNELYLLRGDGCFSTLDLLELDLVTAEGSLYKWGAAPSFLRTGRSVQKIGTASPPPGLGVGEAHRAGCVRLSLHRGEQLVLITDGIPEHVCEQYLRTCGALSPQELAAGVVACASESEPDDRTAAVIELAPVILQSHHTTRRARNVSKPDARPHI